VCHGFRLAKWDDFYQVKFDHFEIECHFSRQLRHVSVENWLEPKTEPPSGNLACPNPWNTLYQFKLSLLNFNFEISLALKCNWFFCCSIFLSELLETIAFKKVVQDNDQNINVFPSNLLLCCVSTEELNALSSPRSSLSLSLSSLNISPYHFKTIMKTLFC